jgi:hypothetical protein
MARINSIRHSVEGRLEFLLRQLEQVGMQTVLVPVQVKPQEMEPELEKVLELE